MLTSLVFDFDGVLVDSEPLHYQAFVMLGKSIGFEFTYDQYLDQFIGFDDRDAFRVMLTQADRAEPDAGRVADLCEKKQQVFDQLVAQGVPAIPGAVELVHHCLDDRLPLAIASGATRQDIDLMLQGLDLVDAFPVIVSADDVTHSKPDPQTYALAVQQLAEHHPDAGITPGTSLAIEDTAPGLHSAKAAGLRTFGLTTTTPPEKLHEAERLAEDLTLVNLTMLKAWYGGASIQK